MTKITIDRATVEQALEALNAALSDDQPYIEKSKQAITALRQALEQPNEFSPDWDQIKPFNDRIAELERVAKQAMAALKKNHYTMIQLGPPNQSIINEAFTAFTALRQALEQSAERVEPVATLWQHGETGRTRITTRDEITDCDARWFKAADLYTHPPVIDKSAAIRIATALGWEPKREWVDLTDEEVIEALKGISFAELSAFKIAKIMASKLKEKNYDS